MAVVVSFRERTSASGDTDVKHTQAVLDSIQKITWRGKAKTAETTESSVVFLQAKEGETSSQKYDAFTCIKETVKEIPQRWQEDL